MKIGILGLAGSGKDTVASMLQQHFPFEITRYSAPLKTMAHNLFGSDFDDRQLKEVDHYIDPDQMLDITFNGLTKVLTADEMIVAGELYVEHLSLKQHISPRLYQQIVGTEIARKVRPTVWVDVLKARKGSLLVPDVRFPNELLDINIWVRRDNVAILDGVDVHPSEQLARSFHYDHNPYGVVDHIIVNNGTQQELSLKVQDLVKTLSFELQGK